MPKQIKVIYRIDSKLNPFPTFSQREIQTDPLTKVNYILTEFLMSYLNGTAEYIIVSSWGYKDDKTNEYSGMVGQLVRREAELGASPLFMTVERVPIIQYIASPTSTGSRFVFRSPKLSYTDNVFLLPFDNLVWYCLIFLVVTTAGFLIVSIFVEWKYVKVDLDEVNSAEHTQRFSLKKKINVRFSENTATFGWRHLFCDFWCHLSARNCTSPSMYSCTHHNGGGIHNIDVSLHELFGKHSGIVAVALNQNQNSQRFI